MRIAIALLLVIAVIGCTTVTDGAFKQINGHPIDYANLDRLAENRSTVQDAIGLLGEPTSRTTQASNVEIFEYRSMKKRESVETTLGVAGSRSSQTFEEIVSLTFRNGTLVQKKKESSTSFDKPHK